MKTSLSQKPSKTPSSLFSPLPHPQLPSNMSTYLLEDYTFLNQYTLIDSSINTQSQFLARINSTLQLVKFIKKPFLPTNTPKGLNMYKRFQAMFQMFQKGLVLSDNMFILEEGLGKYFYYVIQPYLTAEGMEMQMPFVTLQQYLIQNRHNMITFEARKVLFVKVKNLLDNLLLSGQAYCGLNSKNIVIDDQGNTFLMPFNIEFNISNKPYQRSYYPPEVLKHLIPQTQKQPLKSLQKWDIWSFGCVVADIFLYLTPCFMSTSVERQMKKIEAETQLIFEDFRAEFVMNGKQNIIEANTESQCSINQHILNSKDQVQKIMNFLLNAFNYDQNCRLISFESNQKTNEIERALIRPKTTRISLSNRGQKRKTTRNQQSSTRFNLKQNEFSHICKDNFKELNICQQLDHEAKDTDQNASELFDFELKFKIFYYKGPINSYQEISVLVEFCNGQKFKFFIDLASSSDQQKQNIICFEIDINKKITFSKKSLTFVQNLLQDQVVVTIGPPNYQFSDIDYDQISQLFINLSSLLIRDDEGKRMWKKPIKGLYATQSDSFVSSKLKIQANLTELTERMNETSIQRISKIAPSVQQDQQVESRSPQTQDAQQTSRFLDHYVKNEDILILKPSKLTLRNEMNTNRQQSSEKPKIQSQSCSQQSQTLFPLQNRAKKLIKQSRPISHLTRQSDLSSKLKKLLIR